MDGDIACGAQIGACGTRGGSGQRSVRAQRGKVLLRKCRVPRKINKDARAPRAGLPSELQNHAAGAPLQFSQFFPVISRVCVRGRGKSRGSKRVCRGALVSGNVPGKVQSAYPARTARAALIGRIFVLPASTQLTALFFFFHNRIRASANCAVELKGR